MNKVENLSLDLSLNLAWLFHLGLFPFGRSSLFYLIYRNDWACWHNLVGMLCLPCRSRWFD